MKRVAIAAYGRARVAPLSGDAWLSFLDEHGGTVRFTDGPGRVFGDAIYARPGRAPFDRSELGRIAEEWIRSHELPQGGPSC